MRFVLDSGAMIAYLRHEPGAEAVRDLVAKEPPSCFAHAVNMCEVYYYFLRRGGEEAAQIAVEGLRSVGVLVREDMDEALWQQAGMYKVRCEVPLADAFAISLAERLEAEIVTSDRGDFEPLARAGVCRVRFIR